MKILAVIVVLLDALLALFGIYLIIHGAWLFSRPVGYMITGAIIWYIAKNWGSDD